MSVTLPAALAAAPARRGGLLPRRLLGLIVPACLIAAWWWATRGDGYSLIPSPVDVVKALLDLAFGTDGDAFTGSLGGHLLASVGRVYGAFFLACLAALPLGLLIGRLRLARELLDPMLQVLRPIPVTAWLPLSMILFGLGARSAFFLVALGAFFPILVNHDLRRAQRGAAVVRGGGHAGRFPGADVPDCGPAGRAAGIFTGFRLGLGFAWVVIVVGEMTGVQTGLGAMIMDARQLSRTDIVVAGMAVIGAVGFLSDLAVQTLGRRLLRWSPLHG